MVVMRLAYVNTKRILRHKALRLALVCLPLAVAVPRAVFAKSIVFLRAAELCPVVCLLLICAVLYTQWSMDSATGLVAGLRSSPISRRGIVTSRALSGALILAAQMAVFGAILAVRF